MVEKSVVVMVALQWGSRCNGEYEYVVVPSKICNSSNSIKLAGKFVT